MNKTPAIISDLDGTLIKMCHRDIHDAKKAYGDMPIPHIKEMLEMYHNNYTIIFVTGRNEQYRDVTEKWIANNMIYGFSYILYMRPFGDKREDTEIKTEIYNQNIKDNYDVKFVLEDRDRCVCEWRRIGVPCLQVADGNF
jgi:hypothetical protein